MYQLSAKWRHSLRFCGSNHEQVNRDDHFGRISMLEFIVNMQGKQIGPLFSLFPPCKFSPTQTSSLRLQATEYSLGRIADFTFPEPIFLWLVRNPEYSWEVSPFSAVICDSDEAPLGFQECCEHISCSIHWDLSFTYVTSHANASMTSLCIIT